MPRPPLSPRPLLSPRPRLGRLARRARHALRSTARAGVYAWVVAAPIAVGAQTVVSFPSADGGIVFGDLLGSGSRMVVLVHGGQFTRQSWTEPARSLADLGFQTLSIDLRGRGESRGGPGAETDDAKAYLDVMGAVRFARSRGAESVSIVGASWGGWAAARASIELEEGSIDRIVLMAASSVDAPERIQGSKLFITTRDDFMGSGTLRLPAIRDQFERAQEPKRLVVLDGSAHAQHVFRTEQGPRLWDEIVRFLMAR